MNEEPDMPGNEAPRRWDDIAQLIDARVGPAVKQEITPYRLTLEQTAQDVAQLKTVVFGSAALGVRGMVERMGAMEGKIDTLLDGQTQREKDWSAMRDFLKQEEARQTLLKAIHQSVRVAMAVVGGAALIAGLVATLASLGIIHL